MFEIPKEWIAHFIEWNTCPVMRKSLEVDKRIVHAILLMCVDKASLANREIPDGVLNFIHGKFLEVKWLEMIQ